MCIAVPGTILEVQQIGGRAIARIDFGAQRRRVDLDYVPSAKKGDHVMIHGTHAISIVSAEDAERAWGHMSRMGLLAAETDLVPPEYFED